MSLALIFSALAAFALAYANGANDNSKGVATLVGGGTMQVRPAIIYATIMTFLGSATAIFLAETLIRTFGGKGIVPDSIIATSAFPLSVGIAAALTVLLATRLGIPISTTHSIVGAIVGVGIASEIIWSGVWLKFVYPLLAAPAIAFALTVPLYMVLRWTRRRLGVTNASCVCVGRAQAEPVVAAPNPAAASAVVEAPAVTTGRKPDCARGLGGRFIGLDTQRALDWSHFVTAGAVSFARGLNDTPKIAGILLAAGAVAAAEGEAISPTIATLTVGIGIALGGLFAARRVAVTMSKRITGMNDGQGFTANLVTAVLVIFASRLGVPVSTTHVSCGSLFGIGLANRRAHWKMIGSILLAWVTTLPLAAVLAWLCWSVIS